MSIEINGYRLMAFKANYQTQLVAFIAAGYKDLGYEHLELDGLDSDLSDIKSNYSEPSCFMLLINNTADATSRSINSTNDSALAPIIGTVAVKISGKESSLKRVFVSPSHRGKSLGKLLSLWAFDYAKSQGAEVMHIWSGTKCLAAHQLYAKLGAKDMHQKRFIGGKDEVSEFYFLKAL